MRLRLFIFLSFILNYAAAQIPGKSMVLNGTSDWVEVPSNSSFDVASGLTLEAWVYPCNISGEILNKLWCGGNQDQFHFYTSNGYFGFVWNNAANCSTVNTYQSTASVLSVGQWYHVASVHTNTGVSLYLNGVPISGSLTSGSYSNINISTSPFRIGVYRAIAGNYASYYKGRIDEVRVWNTALTPAQILARYNTPLTESEPNLVAYYTMELTASGQSITVPNSANLTGTTNDGTSRGTSTSPYFLDNSTSVNCAALPVELISFSANPIEDAIVIEWKTSFEKNNRLFVLEKSLDGTDFKKIFTIPGSGTNSSVNNYTFTDQDSLDENIYYKLKQVDEDGHHTFSEIIYCRARSKFSIYPNPFSEELNINIGKQEKNARLILFNSQGRAVFMNDRCADGKITFNLNYLQPGLYYLTILCPNGTEYHEKVVKL